MHERIRDLDSLPILGCLMAAFLVASTTAAEDWNQWRGPRRDGSAIGAIWADDLSGLERVWSSSLGKGHSGPLIVGQRVLVVETLDESTAGIRALAISDGGEIWKQHWSSGGEVPFFAAANGDWVRSTPLADEKSVYVGDMLEVLRAFDLESGQLLWSVDFPKRFGTSVPDFGFASSPLLDGEQLILQAANSIVALDRRTGKTLWRSQESEGKIQESGAFSSPIMASLAGRRQLLVQSRSELQGVDRKKVAKDSWAHLAVSGDLLAVRDLESVILFQGLQWHGPG